MIPLTTLYDYYIDRPKLSEKKPIWVYPPPLKSGGNKNFQYTKVAVELSKFNFLRWVNYNEWRIQL